MTAIDVSSLNGFSSPVSLTYSWIGTAPSGVSVSLTSPVTPTGTPATSPLTVSISASATIGSFTLGVTGSSAALNHTIDVEVAVVAPVTATSSSTTSSAAPGPVCLIATATYGSQMAPEVQLLRNFRDQSVMNTRAGSSFMVLFNSWYYSFSPGVAAYISAHILVRTAMKAVLYPLIGILFLTSNLYTATSSYPELGILLSGLLASGLIGAFYIGLPLSLFRRIARKYRGSAVAEKYVALILISGIGVLAVGEFLYSPALMMISSAMIVLSTLTLFALVTSRKIAQRLC